MKKLVIAITILLAVFCFAGTFTTGFAISSSDTTIPGVESVLGFRTIPLRATEELVSRTAEFAIVEFPVELEGNPVEFVLVNNTYLELTAEEGLPDTLIPPSFSFTIDESGVVKLDATQFIPDLLDGNPLKILVKSAIPDSSAGTVRITGAATCRIIYR